MSTTASSDPTGSDSTGSDHAEPGDAADPGVPPEADDGAPVRHGREVFFVESEGVVGGADDAVLLPTPAAEAAAGVRGSSRAAREEVAPDFRFSRLGPKGTKLPRQIRVKVARAMTVNQRPLNGPIPAGYTYLGQFADHDLTFDRTSVQLGETVSPADMLLGRSPTLDLDSLYGAGPEDPESERFYKDDRHLKVGRTVRVGPDRGKVGFDLPRAGDGSPGQRRRVLIPDRRNDENLAVAQTHLAFIRFHNEVVDRQPDSVPRHRRFQRARARVTLHYQWVLRHDYLTRICDRRVVSDVFRHGRKIHEVGADPLSMPTMPLEFAVAAYRFGHSMVRTSYDWNRVFDNQGGTLDFLFEFSGTSGFLGGGDLALPANWVADWRRLYRFRQVGRDDLAAPRGGFNRAERMDTHLSPILGQLPPGSFGGRFSDLGTMAAHLAFRNLTRAGMVELASGQQMAALLRSKGVPVETLTRRQVADGNGEAAVLDRLTSTQKDRFLADTPLWFYVLREAELNNGRLTGVGARIVVETFHRAMEGSQHSIVRNPAWRPSLGRDGTFTMMDLLLVAYGGRKDQLAPLG
jgi:hypothetical protein